MKKLAIISLVWFVIGCVCGFFMGKAKYDQPIEESVKRDTVTLHDTIPHYYPQPVDGTEVKTEYRWLTRVLTDTVVKTDVITCHDSVLVEVPITSKHYRAAEYDAWVSGYEPSLDSIKVYRETQYITETITKVVKDQKHFFLDVSGGFQYAPNTKASIPFAELGLAFKPGRFSIGAYGGYAHDIKDNKAEPYFKAKVSYDIISF